MAAEKGALWSASSPLHIVWAVGTCSKNDIAKKLTRKKCLCVNISEMTELVKENKQQFSLQVAATLNLGLCRIHHQKMHFLEKDTKSLLEMKENLLDTKRAKYHQVTLAKPPKVFKPYQDLEKELSQTPTRPFDQEHLMNLPHPGSLSPSSFDVSFQGEERDITFKEELRSRTPISLEQSLLESDDEGLGEDFLGDDDQSLEVVCARERANPADTSHDQVLLLDDKSGSFVPMGGDDDHSGDSVVPQQPTPFPIHSEPFEMMFLNPGNPSRPITPPSVRVRPHISSHFILEELALRDIPPKRAKSRKKDTGLDKAQYLPENEPEGEQRPLDFKTRPGPRKEMLLKKTKATELLNMTKVFLEIESPELVAMLKRFAVRGANISSVSPISVPSLSALQTSTPLLNHSELEGGRRAGSTTEQSDQGSNLQGSQMSGRSLKSATPLQRTTSLTRGNPLVDHGAMVKNLSPIADVDDEVDSYEDMGGMDDVYSLEQTPPHIRPLNNSVVEVFGKLVEQALSDKTYTVFTVFLQDGCSRMEAARTFFHLLISASLPRYNFKIVQYKPYGPIFITECSK